MATPLLYSDQSLLHSNMSPAQCSFNVVEIRETVLTVARACDGCCTATREHEHEEVGNEE